MDAELSDQEILELWHLCAETAVAHKPATCGHEDGRCRYRKLNLEESDALLDEWLTRHGRPMEMPAMLAPLASAQPGPVML